MRTPPDVEQRFQEEERAYWQQREELLKQYAGKWVAIQGGKVVAVGEQMNKVAGEAFRCTGLPVMFVALVGEEDVEFRVREAALGRFDARYRRPIPRVTAAVSGPTQTAPTEVDFVVDTGADITLLRSSVADRAGLWGTPAGWAQVAGFAGGGERRRLYFGRVGLAGEIIDITSDCRDDLLEDILGRDVINEFRLTLCAKHDEVEFSTVAQAPDPPTEAAGE